MKKILISLLSLLFTIPAQAYVMSETLVEFAQRNNPETLILGDAHYAGKTGQQHFNLIKSDLTQRSKKDTTTYVSLEDRQWEQKQTYTTNTLNDLIVFARSNSNTLGSMTFKSTDWRTKGLVWPLFFCSEFYEAQYTQGDGLYEKFENIGTWLKSIYGNTIPTGGQVLAESRSLMKRIKQGAQKYSCHELNSCVNKIDEKFEVIKSAFEKNANQKLTDIFYQWLQRDESATTFIEFHTHLQTFTNSVADAGFIIDFLENKNNYDQVIFYVGHAHAIAIARALQELEHTSNIKKYKKGPSFVPQGSSLIALNATDIDRALGLLPCEKRLKTQPIKTGNIDIMLVFILIIMGCMLASSAQAPRKRSKRYS